MKNAGRSRFVASQGNVPVALYPSDQFPTIASIPTGAVVYDSTDGVVKRKVGDYLVDIQYNVIGYGPIADAPVASENDGEYYYDNVTGNLYQSVGGEWVGVNAWLMDGARYITVNGENINVDDPNIFIFIDENNEPFINENNEPITTEN